jgi:hydrogenase maturation protease
MPDTDPAGGILVLGAGDATRRDLGVGLVVAEALAQEALGESVTVQTSGVGMEVLLSLEGRERVLLACAADLGAAPGTVRSFTLEEADAELLTPLPGPGGMSVSDWLELAALAGPVPSLVVVGVQPGEVAPGTGLTLPVGQAVAVAMAEVRRLLAPPA